MAGASPPLHKQTPALAQPHAALPANRVQRTGKGGPHMEMAYLCLGASQGAASLGERAGRQRGACVCTTAAAAAAAATAGVPCQCSLLMLLLF